MKGQKASYDVLNLHLQKREERFFVHYGKCIHVRTGDVAACTILPWVTYNTVRTLVIPKSIVAINRNSLDYIAPRRSLGHSADGSFDVVVFAGDRKTGLYCE